MTRCVNPECISGRTPGLVVVGKGNAKNPVLGQSMRWSWVNCLACSATDDQKRAGAAYKPANRSPQEIAQRAQLATDRAKYEPAPKAHRGLAAIKQAAGNGTTHAASATIAPPDNSKELRELAAKIDKLIEQNTKLAEQNGKLVDQLGEMMIENRALRMQIEAQKSASSINHQA